MNPRHARVETFYRAALGAFLFVLVLIMYRGTNDPTIHIKELLISWAALALTGSYVLLTWVARIPWRRPPIFREVLLCLLGFLFVSALFSEFRAISLRETGHFFSLFALYWLAAQVFRSTAQVARLFTVFCVAVSVAAVYAVMQLAGLDPFPWEDTVSDTYTNLPATFGNPNYAAHALILAIIMAAGLYRMGHRWTAWLLPLMFFHLYSTEQRAGWIALAGAAFLVAVGWVFLRSPRRPAVAVTATVAAAVALGCCGAAGVMVWTHLKTGHAFPLDLSLLLRYQSYVSATNMLLDAPVLGHGPAVYGLAYAPYWTPFEQDWFAQEIRMNGHVHNDLLELAIDGGLAAAGLYLTALLFGICYGLLLAARGATPDQRRMGFVFAALVTAFAIDGLFGFNLRVPVTAAIFFLILGLLDGLWAGEAPEAQREKRLPFHGLRLAFVLLLLLSTRQATQDFAGEYHFYAGMRAHDAGDLQAAREAYTRSEKAAPWNWHAARRIGMTLLDAGQAGEGLPHLERSLEKNPHYILTRLPMARASLMMAQEAFGGEGGPEVARGYLDEAREHAHHVLELAPRFPTADELLARVESIAAIIARDSGSGAALEQAHWMAAREHLKRALENGAGNAGDLYRMLVRVERGLDNREGAERAILGAVQTSTGGDGEAWAMFLSLAQETGDYRSMRDALLRQVATLRPSADGSGAETDTEALATALDFLATVQTEGFDNPAAALAAYREAVIYGPLRPALWSRFAAHAYEHGGLPVLEEAIVDSSDALEAAGATPLPQVAAVRSVIVGGGAALDGASRLLVAGVRSHPHGDPLRVEEAFGWAARILLDHYRRAEAQGEAPCESALNLGIVSAGIRSFRAAEGLFEAADGCLEGELKAIAAVHWADTLVRTGRFDGALELLERAQNDFPEQFEVRWGLARTLAQAGRIAEARERYDALLASPELSAEGRKQVQAERDGLPQP